MNVYNFLFLFYFSDDTDDTETSGRKRGRRFTEKDDGGTFDDHTARRRHDAHSTSSNDYHGRGGIMQFPGMFAGNGGEELIQVFHKIIVSEMFII